MLVKRGAREVPAGSREWGLAALKIKAPASSFKGRPATTDPAKVRALRTNRLTPTTIGKKLGIARSSVYRLLGEGDTPLVMAVPRH